MSTSPTGAPRVLVPSLRSYAWGDRTFIPTLLGREATGEPCAEAWFGAHPVAPSGLVGEDVGYDQWIAADPGSVLGPRVNAAHGQLPFLLKLLSAARPLSIQVHPNAARAARGFAEEEAAGIPLDARERRFKDPHHKPELVVALTPFDALCGFRPAPQRAAALARAPELASVLTPADDSPDALHHALARYYDTDDTTVTSALQAWLDRLAGSDPAPDSDERWVLRVHEATGGETPDRGLPFVVLLHRLRLQPGQALFLPAGVPHAYLGGAAVELMANSDNVIRAGLTQKHIDPQTLLEVVRFDSGPPVLLDPIPRGDSGAATYPVPTAEFGLERVELAPGQPFSCSVDGPELYLAVSGADSSADVDGLDVSWTGGQCLALPHGGTLHGTARTAFTMYRAHVPNDARPIPSFRGRTPTPLRFGTSGLRGKVEDITDLEAYVNTAGFLGVMLARGVAVPGTTVPLGGDLRPSTNSPERSIMRAVAQAVRDAGMQVLNLGPLPTPALTLEGLVHNSPSIMVTGSHIPFDRNGIKFNTPSGEVLKSDEAEILAAVARARQLEYARPPELSHFDDDGWFKPGASVLLEDPTDQGRARYLARYTDAFPHNVLQGLRVALYEHSAVGRELIADILRALGAEVLPCGRASSFVPIDTEALGEDGLATLQRLADEANAKGPHGAVIDAVISTDGDSDRPLVAAVGADGRVSFIGGDVLGVLVARALGADAVAVPVSATDMVEPVFGDRVGVQRTRIGSPWVIAAMNDMAGQCVVGWEANGGFLHASPIATEQGTLAPLPTRDAALPIVVALRIAAEAKQRGSSLLAEVDTLPSRHSRAGLLDAIEPARSAALKRRYAMPRAELRGASTSSDGFVGVGIEGHSVALLATDLPVLTRLWARLQRHFTTDDGFTPIRAIDMLDGIRITFESGDVAHVRPSGNAPQLRIYAQADTAARADAIVRLGLADGGLLGRLLAGADETRFCDAVLHNVALGQQLFAGELPEAPAALVGAVCGSAPAQSFWQGQLDAMRPDFGAAHAHAFFEDLPVNQAFGLLLLWERARPRYVAGQGALIAFVFGSGTRATPITEAECGQKPAIDSFARVGPTRRRASLVELAMRTFAPVEAYLRRSGFEGMVVKWGDEVQIPTLDLAGSDPRFDAADIVRFVSMQPITEDTAANKDWVGVDADGRVTAFIPRRPLSQMAQLADSGILQRRGDALIGGVNLGSIAISGAFADVLLETFHADVHDEEAQRGDRPDLDPQLFTALTIAALPEQQRSAAWQAACSSAPAMAQLAERMPSVIERLVGALQTFEQRHGRPVKLMAMDFGDQYWGDIGQHHSMASFFGALRDDTPGGTIARALAEIPEFPDAQGNRVVGDTQLGADVTVTGSVLIDARVHSGEIRDSVLLGTHAGTVVARDAFDIGSTASALTLEARAGGYKIVSGTPIAVGEGERCTTVFLPECALVMRVHESTDLRDKRATYDVPLSPNTISFKDAHAKAMAGDPESLRQARIRARELVAQTLPAPRR
ncbi:MAG: mannose-6-phosphate isomerase, class I [Nannocystales bacterium]